MMPVFREDVDFFFNNFIKVSNPGQGDASVWAVGSYKGKFILTVVNEEVDSITQDMVLNKPVFVFFDDLVRFSPDWKYDK